MIVWCSIPQYGVFTSPSFSFIQGYCPKFLEKKSKNDYTALITGNNIYIEFSRHESTQLMNVCFSGDLQNFNFYDYYLIIEREKIRVFKILRIFSILEIIFLCIRHIE